MAQFKVAYNRVTKVATVLNQAEAVPGGSVDVGTFEHADVEPAIKDLEFDTNHVIYQHVRDALYKRSVADPSQPAKHPNNIMDMGSIKITVSNAAKANIKHPSLTEGSDSV